MTGEELKKNYKKKWTDENRRRVNEYNREWRKKNTDKVKEYNRRYWDKKAKALSQEEGE